MRCLVVAILFFTTASKVDAANGDYRSIASTNWTTNTTWQADYGSGFVAATAGDYPGKNPGTGLVTIQNNNIVSLDASIPNAIGSLTIAGTANNTGLVFDGLGAWTLSVTGATTINGPTTNAMNNYVTVSLGSFTTGSVAMINSGTATRDSYISIPSGSVTVSGNIAMPGANTLNYILFPAGSTGTLYLAGAFTGTGGITSTVGGGAISPSAGTVNYNSAGNQSIASFTYFNLATSIGGIKTLPAAAITINGSLDVSSSTLAFDAAAARIVTVTGNCSGAGTIDMSSGSRTHTLNLNGSTNSIGSLVTAAVASTVAYNLAGAQTVFASSSYRNLNFTGAGIKTLQGDATVGGALTVGAGSTFNLGTTATIVDVVGTATLTGSLNFGSTDKTVTITGNISTGAAGSLNMSGSTNHLLKLRGTANTFTAGFTFTPGNANQTVTYDGDNAQTIMQMTYNHLSLENYNALSVTARTKTLAGTTIINKDLTITGIGVTPRVTLQLSTFTLTVNGYTNINGYGILDDNSTTGTNTFVGLVSVNSNGSWTTSVAGNSYTLNGGLTFDGLTFTPNTSIFNFTINDQSISGANAFTLYRVVCGTAGKTITNNTTNAVTGLTISNLISGVGNFTNAGLLNLTVTGNPFTITGTLDFATNPNTVNYSGAGIAQTIAGVAPSTTLNFYNLTISGARAATNVTLWNGGTIGISNVLTLSATFTTGNYVTASNTVNYNGTIAQDIPALVSTISVAYNNLTISGGSTKTLTNNISVGGILNLNSGILELSNYNLTITNNAAGAITGAFDATHMISTGGTGYLVKNAASAQVLNPIGSGGFYSPMTLTSIAPNTGTYSIKAIPTGLNPIYINKYWDLITSLGGKTITATFQYDPAELNGASNTIVYLPNPPGTTVQCPPTTGVSTFGANTFTITGNSGFTSGYWSMGGNATYYSYMTGDWNTASTWTSDPSGTLQIGSTIPGYNDNVVILTGRTVSLPAIITTQNLNVTINGGGTLDLSTYSFSNGLTSLSGQGTLRLASSSFPTVATNTFVAVNGGATEYYNSSDFTLPVAQTTYNNLTINAPSVVATQLSNITLNGNLYVRNGTFKINNDVSVAKLNLTVNGNVNVDNGAAIAVGTGITNPAIGAVSVGGAAPFINYYTYFHTVILKGDLINNGTVRFTNLDYPIYNAFPPTVAGPTAGAASVYFQGPTSNVITCNGTTDFYNLILDKGTDQTYTLTISAQSYPNFRLFGANTLTTEAAVTANPNIRKALWIRTGTLILQGQTSIPSLTEGTTVGPPNSDYYIPSNGAMILDGPETFVLSTADDYREINTTYGVSAPSNAAIGVTTGGYSSVDVFGKLQINDGYLSTRESGGLITSNIASGTMVINGGVVDAKQFLSTTGSSSYSQSGGTLILRGRFQRTPASYSSMSDLTDTSTASLNTSRALNGTSTGFGTFNLEQTTNIFSMSGGVIRIYDVCDVATGESFDVKSAAANISVTDGTIEFIPTTGTVLADATNYFITSTASLGNVLINRASGSAIVQLTTGYPLTVLNDLTLSSGDFNANSQNVSIGGDYSIATGTTYTTGTNTTVFNGTGTQTFTVDLASALTLNNLTMTKSAGDVLSMAGSQTAINVSGVLNLTAGTFDDNGDVITVAGNVYNSGIHIGTGKISLTTAATVQTIDGGGTFQNLELNNTNASAAPISLLAGITVNGVLNLLADKIFNIASYNLTIASTGSIATGTGFSNTCYIHSNGQSGDGGITKVYTANTPFTFPVGCFSTNRPATYAYTPAEIGFSSSPTSYGSLTIIPVGYEYPATTVKNQSLTFFWRIRSTGFTGYAGKVTHSFIYSPADVNGIVANYIPSLYDLSANTWNNGDFPNINTGTYTITDWTTPAVSANFLDDDYTAGDNTTAGGAFGTPLIFYSIAGTSGAYATWSSNTTWSYTSGGAAVPAGAVAGVNFPGPSSIVIIENAHFVRITATANCANLTIKTGCALDVQTFTLSTFSMVLSDTGGNGTIRVAALNPSGSTYTFPSGDFSSFDIGLGTTELYTTNAAAGTTYWLPQTKTTYGNLILAPLGGSNIIFGNLSITIYGTLTAQGQNADSWFLPTWNGAYPTAPTAVIAKTITINGDMDIVGGGFGFYMNAAHPLQNIIVNGNVTVQNSNGAIDDWGNGNGLKAMSIGGSLINNTNGIVNAPASTVSRCNFTNIPLTFFSSTNATISNTINSPTTTFGQVIINKGNSQATTLTCDIGGTLTTPVNNWLTLQNGTFSYERTNPAAGQHFTISTGSFTIPQTAGLKIDMPSNTNNIRVLIGNATSDASDLFLNGTLNVANGNVYIGPITGTALSNNDIEYSGNYASLRVSGGNLYVNGQIRRPTTSTNGVLSYIQTGGAVTINGLSSGGGAVTAATRAKLEIVNTGSVFNMSGSSTLTIVRGSGTTFGDLYLRPTNSTITGGTILFDNAVPNTAQTYSMDANVSLYNLTITGAGAAKNATVGLSINPLVLKGSLTFTNANSILNANNFNVSIAGNLTNNGLPASYLYGTNTTTFNGVNQSINGTSITNFYDMSISCSGSLSVNSSFTVNRNLSINTGTLILYPVATDYKITLLGNLINNSSYIDNNTSGGGIMLAGSAQQQISGTGAFGRLELNNAAGAITLNDISLQNDLVLTTGILTISSNLLTLSQTSSIGGSPFSATKMIKTDGVSSSSGVSKFFNTGAATFTFPVGVTGKYTPADFDITANTSLGYYINLTPVNQYAPSVMDPNNVLKYYWRVQSSGLAGFTANAQLYYNSSDVVGGPESDYVSAWLENPGTVWIKSAPGAATDNVDEALNSINFSFSSRTNISGNYTCGNDTAIPDNMPTYISNANGVWSDNSKWTNIANGLQDCPVGGPNGFKVIINTTITTDVNQCNAYQTTITGNGILRVVTPTYGHNLGNVDIDQVTYPNIDPTTTPTLYVESGNLPAGTYTSFIDCAGKGTLDYGGTGTYSIFLPGFTSIPYLYLSGTGTRILPNTNLTICQRLKIDGPTLDNSSNNKKLTILGTMERYNTGAFNSGSGAGAIVSFAGSTAQTLGGTLGDFTGTNGFNHFEINNTAGLTIGNNTTIEIKGNLLLTNGIITTTSTNMLSVVNTSTSAVIPTGGTSTSYVNGPMTKQFLNGNSFLYPIGKLAVGKGHDCTITSTAAASSAWTVEYFNPNPTGIAANLNNPLVVENMLEYWSVNTTAAKTAKIRLAWDSQSDLNGSMTINGYTDLRIAQKNGTRWDAVVSTPTGVNNLGDVVTTGSVNISTTPIDFSIASISATKPIATLAPSGPVCGNAGIPVTFTTYITITLPYTLYYTVDGGAVQSAVVNSLPYTLPTTALGGDYLLTGFMYDNSTVAGAVDPTVISVYASPNTSNAGTDQSLCGVTSTLLNANAAVAPSTGLWTIVSGTGGTLMANTSPGSNFLGLLGRSYILRWTISNGSCVSQSTVSIAFSYSPAAPLAFSTAQTTVCQSSSNIIYTIPIVSGATSYQWSYSGTGATITGTSNSVLVSYNSTATSGTLSVSAVNGCGVGSTRNLAITVTPTPIATFSYTGDPYCQNNTNPLPTFSGGGVAGVFSSTAGLVFVSTATGEVDLIASTPGTYTVTNTIAAAGGCATIVATSSITVYALSTWTAGNNSTDWFDAGNWGCGVPTSTVDAIIPPGRPYYPIIVGSGAVCKDVRIYAGASLTIATTDTLTVYGNWTNNDTFNANSGTVLFEGPSLISGAGINTFNHFIIDATGNVTSSAGNVNITGNWINSGTFNPNNGTITFTGSNSQLITSAIGDAFNNITMQKSANELTLNTDIHITTALTLTSGNVRLGNYNMTLGTSSANATINPATVTNTSYVIADGTGFVKHFVNSAGASATANVNLYNFPIGDSLNFTPCAIHLKSATTLNSGAFITANVTDARIPGAWTVDYPTYLSRYWTIEPCGTGLLDDFVYESYVYYIPTPDGSGGDMVGSGTIMPCKETIATGVFMDALPGEMQDIDIGSTLGAARHEFRWDARTSFSRFSGRSGVALPIELISFRAKYTGKNTVSLKWSTASETNNDYFQVERSADGIVFTPILNVNGAGSSTKTLTYSTSDNEPLAGISYYRLKQVDYDGQFSYSEIVSVEIHNLNEDFKFNAFPNPSNGSDLKFNLKAKRGETIDLVINDMSGKENFHKQFNVEDDRETLYVLDQNLILKPGVYFISVTGSTNSIREKLVVK